MLVWRRLIPITTLAVGLLNAQAAAVTATFSVRLAPTESDSVLNLSDPDDQVLDLELWVTLTNGPVPPEGLLGYAVYLSPSSGNVISFDSSSFVNVLSQDPPFEQGEDNSPHAGAFGRSVGFLPSVPIALGDTRLATFSVTAVGEGSVMYAFLDDPPLRPWRLDFGDLSEAEMAAGPALPITVLSVAQNAQITAWRSLRTHPGVGDLPITLDAAAGGAGPGRPTLETRQGGIRKLQVVFDKPVTLDDPAGVMVAGRTTVADLPGPTVVYPAGSVTMPSATTMEIAFDAATLPDRTCYTVTLASDMVSPPLSGDRDVHVRSMWGDVTGDGLVNLTDVLVTRANAGKSASESPQFDVDVSGVISTSDAVAVKSGITAEPRKMFCEDPASVVAWRSIRMHGGAPMAIVLDMKSGGNSITGPTTETRAGGLLNLEIEFDRPVTLMNPAGVTIVGRTTAGSALAAPVDYTAASVAVTGSHTIGIALDPGAIPDQTCCTITLAPGLLSAGLIGDRDVNIRLTMNDTTGDGRVSLSDALFAKARLFTDVSDTPQLDVDVSGTIDWTDVLTIKSRIASPLRQTICP